MFLFALVVRLVVAVGIFVAAGGLVFEDSYYYNMMAADVAEGSTGSWDPYTEWLYQTVGTYLVPVSGLYILFWPTPIIGQVLSAILGATACALLARLTLQVASAGWALLAGGILAVLPSQVLWSSLILKEAPEWVVTIGVAVMLGMATRSDSRRKLLLIAAGLVLALVALRFLRMHVLVVTAWAVGLAAWMGSSRHRMARGIGAVVLAVFVPWVLGAGPAGLSFVSSAGSLEERRAFNAMHARTAFVPTRTTEALQESVARAEDQAQELQSALREPATPPLRGPGGAPTPDAAPDNKRQLLRAAYRAVELRAEQLRAQLEEERSGLIGLAESFGADYDTVRTLQHVPRGLSIMLFWPYPWEGTDNARVQFARVESFVWYPLLLLAGFGLLQAWKHRHVLAFPLLFGGALLAVYVLTEGNAGTAYRHRGEFVWVVVLLAVMGMSRIVSRLREPAR